MNKLFLTMALVFCTMIASAQWSVLTTISKVEGTPACDMMGTEDCEVYEGDTKPTEEDSWNATDKIGIGYQVNEKLMIGATMDGEDKYEVLARYDVYKGVWATCVYNYDAESEDKLMDKMDLGLGYSFKLFDNLHVDPNYTVPAREDENGEREGTLNLSISYKF